VIGWHARLLGMLAVGGIVAAGVAAPAAPAAETRSAIVVFVDANPRDVLMRERDNPGPPADAVLRLLGREPSLRTGLWSASLGRYQRQQVLLDISQGTRQPTTLYSSIDEDGDGEHDDLRFDARARSFENWAPFRDRARDVSQTIRPGLLAGTVPGGAAFVDAGGATPSPAIVAADEGGRVAAVSLGSVETLAQRARAAARAHRLVIVSVAFGSAGRRQLSRLVRERASDELLLIAQLPETPRQGTVGVPPSRYLRQIVVAVGDGLEGSPRSGSTRRDGLVTSIDFAPTILDWLGVQTPDRMRGAAIGSGAAVSPERLAELRERWSRARDGRQTGSLTAIVLLCGTLYLLLGTWRGPRSAARPVLRIGALALLWWPSAVLLAAAVEPATRSGEVFLIAGVSVAAAALTERLLPWARAPLIPALVCLLAYTVDLALGGPLLTLSALGPSVATGGRFYGVSNELEPILPIVLLVGLAAVMTGRAVGRGALALYGASGLALLVVVGAGRLGADVGGVLTVAAGVAAAMLVLLGGGLTRRRIVLAALVPVGALGLLIAIDLGLSGGGHLSRNLTRASDATELWELVARRYELAWQILTRGGTPLVVLAALLAVAFAWRSRAALYGDLPHRAWTAVLVGGLAAGVTGALTNDSGPVLLINAVIALAGVTAYILGRPDQAAAGRTERLAS
jgi:hypothetical protein